MIQDATGMTASQDGVSACQGVCVSPKGTGSLISVPAGHTLVLGSPTLCRPLPVLGKHL